MLTREGWTINMKRTYQIYRDLGLQLSNKTPKRRVKAKLRDDRHPTVEPNQEWGWTSFTTGLRPERRVERPPVEDRIRLRLDRVF